jgi:hypothetical protein
MKLRPSVSLSRTVSVREHADAQTAMVAMTLIVEEIVKVGLLVKVSTVTP